MKQKNVAAFVLALIGSIFGFIGGILWAACAGTVAEVIGDGGAIGYTIGFVVLGVGGAIIGLVGGIQALGFKKGRLVLTAAGLVAEIGHIILSCVAVEGFSFLLNITSIVSVILLLVAVILVAVRKDGQADAE